MKQATIATDAAVQSHTAPHLQRACACGASKGVEDQCPTCAAQERLGVQPKLTVNKPGDRYEQEADRIADRVVSGSGVGPLGMAEASLQRMEEDEEEVQRKPAGLQRQEEEEEEDTLQMKAAGSGAATHAINQAAAAVSSGGAPLSRAERGYFEPRLGRDLSDIRVHDSARAGAAAKGINARAYTLKNNVAFAPGHRDFASTEGRRLMAHELVHTAQQGLTSSFASKSPLVQRAPAKNRRCEFSSEVPSGKVERIVVSGQPPNATIKYHLSGLRRPYTYKRKNVKLTAEHSPYIVTVLPGGNFKLSPKDSKKLGFKTPQTNIALVFHCNASQPDPRKFNYPNTLPIEVTPTGGKGSGASNTVSGEGDGGHSGNEAKEPSADPVEGGLALEQKVDDTPPSNDPGLGLEGLGSESDADQRADTSSETSIEEPEDFDSDAPSLDGEKLGALVTTGVEGTPERFVVGGTVQKFRSLRRGELRQRVRDVAVSTLAYCFELGHPFAEAAVDGPHVKLRLPRYKRARTLDEESLPVMVDMEALEIRFADDLGVTDGNVNCSNEAQECFFSNRLCLPRINIPTASIEQAEDIDTALGAAEAVIDGAEIALTGGASEVVEEGVEQVAKAGRRAARRQARKQARSARKLRRQARRSDKKAIRQARRDLRKSTRKTDTRKITAERKAIDKKIGNSRAAFRKSSEPGYDIEIEVDGVVYRRPKPFKGTWCRFNSPKDCGKTLGNKADSVAEEKAIKLNLPKGKTGDSDFSAEELASLSETEHDAVIRDFMRLNGKTRIYKSEAHHAFPKYLGGPEEQALYSLPDDKHIDFHAGLDKIFKRSAGKAEFDALPMQKKVEIWKSLKLYTRQFDLWNDTKLSGTLKTHFNQMSKEKGLGFDFDDL
ncbi:eCIS core domain-containing protein [Sulfitobacter sp. JB4-11]|uniref:eCIS core domain-containing protein n=1 Tax=Sulfitobacter rhodophyticola TaxID=3238304 RepID=UPI003511D617